MFLVLVTKELEVAPRYVFHLAVAVDANCRRCSGKNIGEVETVVHLVKYYYRRLEFCVITPYDAQRAAIQIGLQAENLPCDTVYNVDSFQGVLFMIFDIFGSRSSCLLQETKQNMSLYPSCAHLPLDSFVLSNG
jgi:hypothetical protein